MKINYDVSVIMPVYNAEQTLQRAIESVLKQTLRNLEIICIDDGSTDNSWKILTNMANKYPQIRLLQQNHLGSGNARNKGIRECYGKYIAFLDADDLFYDANALEIMSMACEKNNLSICGSYRKICEAGVLKDSPIFREENIPIDGQVIQSKEFQHDYDYGSFLFQKEFLIKNNIFFPPYMRYQDPPFFLSALVVAKKFYVMPTTLYVHMLAPDRNDILCKYVNDILQGIIDTLEIAKKNNYNILFERIIHRVEVQYYNSIIGNLSDKTMFQLLEINRMNQDYKNNQLNILNDIYKAGKKIQNLSYSHDLIGKILQIKQSETGFQTFFLKNNIRKVCVYGLGFYGKILIHELQKINIDIQCGIDKNVTSFENLIVRRPEDIVPECDAIIISLLDGDMIYRQYVKNSNNRVFLFSQIINSVYEDSLG